jgi:glyoxylase-like metal-dependent hydrolase (beta-lactamase superfamily II)
MYRIHTFTAAETGLLVNSYLVETADGVVLIDANLLLSDVRALGARIAALHKPLLGVFVTHAHPDHFNGHLRKLRAQAAGEGQKGMPKEGTA